MMKTRTQDLPHQLRSVGLEVSHVIHRHGIEREETAYVDLIDAYPGLTRS